MLHGILVTECNISIVSFSVDNSDILKWNNKTNKAIHRSLFNFVCGRAKHVRCYIKYREYMCFVRQQYVKQSACHGITDTQTCKHSGLVLNGKHQNAHSYKRLKREEKNVVFIKNSSNRLRYLLIQFSDLTISFGCFCYCCWFHCSRSFLFWKCPNK